MDALELALRCTNLIKRTTSRINDITSDLSSAFTSDLSSGVSSKLGTSTTDDAEEAVDEPEPLLEHFSDDDG